VIGVDADAAAAERSRALGQVDRVAAEVPGEADAVFLATPSDALAGWIEKLRAHPATVFDGGSVKAALLETLRQRLAGLPANYVPAHPIAGGETSGPQAARADLFRGRAVIVTPVADTDPERLARVRSWWQRLGAKVREMDPVVHDAIYAVTSHLPHLAAFAYLQQIGPDHLPHAGGGFRDFTRIGASDPAMWSAVFRLNRQALLDGLADYRAALDAFEDGIRADDDGALKALIDRARRNREGYQDD